MGLFPDSSSRIPVSPKFVKKILGNVSGRASASTASATLAKESNRNIQQMSTSWEFVRPNLEYPDDIEKDEPQDMLPPRFIEVQRGKISLGPPKQEPLKDKEVLEARIAELEDALFRLQERVNKSQCNSPILEKELKEQLLNMNSAMRKKDRRTMQTCRDHKALQARFARQENCLQILQNENKSLHNRVRQYERCLDDIMRKVVDAIVLEDCLKDEVLILKNRVRDLEEQNATLSASPAKVRGDEGYCTMSSGQPPQLIEGHLEDLPEEPEWLVSAEPCSAEMIDWSMSQDDLNTVLDDNEWLFNSSSNFLSSTTDDTQTEQISALLEEQITYSDDEEVACKDFTRDFYRLVSIKSESTRSLQSQFDVDGDDEHEDEEEDDEEEATDDSSSFSGRTDRLCSPTPSEAGRAQVLSCTSSDDSDELVIGHVGQQQTASVNLNHDLVKEVLSACHKNNVVRDGAQAVQPAKAWRRSNGWRRISSQCSETSLSPESTIKGKEHIKAPPPVPVRRSFAS